MKFYDLALAKLNEKIQKYDLSFFEKENNNNWKIDESGHAGGYVPIIFSNGEIILEYDNMINGARHFPKQNLDQLSYSGIGEDPRDKKIWVISNIENKEALLSLFKEIQERFFLTENEIIEMTNSFIKEAKKDFFEYNVKNNLFEKINENFNLEDGAYEVGQGDSTVLKIENNIFLYDTYHDCACKIIKDKENLSLLMNIGNPIIKEEQLESATWQNIIKIKNGEYSCNNIYFDKMNHLKYLIVPNKELYKKNDKKVTISF